jgi:hypothetical protein
VPRASKKKAKSASGGSFSIFDDAEIADADSDEELPKTKPADRRSSNSMSTSSASASEAARPNPQPRADQQDARGHLLHLLPLHEGLPTTSTKVWSRDEKNEHNICVPCSQTATQVVHSAHPAKDGARKKKIRPPPGWRKLAAKNRRRVNRGEATIKALMKSAWSADREAVLGVQRDPVGMQ